MIRWYHLFVENILHHLEEMIQTVKKVFTEQQQQKIDENISIDKGDDFCFVKLFYLFLDFLQKYQNYILKF